MEWATGGRNERAPTLSILCKQIVHHVVCGTCPGLREKSAPLDKLKVALDTDSAGLSSPEPVQGNDRLVLPRSVGR